MMRFVFGLCWALVFTKANGLALGAAPLPPTTSPTTLNLRDYVSAPTAIKTQHLYHPSLEAIKKSLESNPWDLHPSYTSALLATSKSLLNKNEVSAGEMVRYVSSVLSTLSGHLPCQYRFVHTPVSEVQRLEALAAHIDSWDQRVLVHFPVFMPFTGEKGAMVELIENLEDTLELNTHFVFSIPVAMGCAHMGTTQKVSVSPLYLANLHSFHMEKLLATKYPVLFETAPLARALTQTILNQPGGPLDPYLPLELVSVPSFKDFLGPKPHGMPTVMEVSLAKEATQKTLSHLFSTVESFAKSLGSTDEHIAKIKKIGFYLIAKIHLEDSCCLEMSYLPNVINYLHTKMNETHVEDFVTHVQEFIMAHEPTLALKGRDDILALAQHLSEL